MATAKTRDRNNSLVLLYNSNPNLTMAEIARMFHISRQRVSVILTIYGVSRNCGNCFHFSEFEHCTCRDSSEVIPEPNRCPDWLPVGRQA